MLNRLVSVICGISLFVVLLSTPILYVQTLAMGNGTPSTGGKTPLNGTGTKAASEEAAPYVAPVLKNSAVDESNVIFPGCRLSVLTGGSASTGVTEANKQKYITGCIEEILRFVIIMVSLIAILRIALSGVMQILPDTGGVINSKGNNPKKIVSDLVVGLFLLVVGWNLVGILNSSFNNVNFLNLPSIQHCKEGTACFDTPEKIKARVGKEFIDKYQKIIAENKFTGSAAELSAIKTEIKKVCDARTTDAIYKTLDTKLCDDKYEEKLTKVGQNGANNPDESVTKFDDEIKQYKAVKAANPADKKVAELEGEIMSACDTYEFKNSTTPRGKEIAAECIKILDAKTRVDYFKALK
jgi:hypothetical protein